MPPGIVLACTLRREDSRDALILGSACASPKEADIYGALPAGAVIGTNSALIGRTAGRLRLQERLGHSSIKMTMDRYSHVTMNMQREAAERLERALGGGA